ncbi:MAG: hypothetical protein PVI06_10720 [Desulfobacterales bacterium]|jgi:hypothetical protein
MEGWFYLKLLWASATLITLILVIFVLIKSRGIFLWRRALHTELFELRQRACQAEIPTKLAIQLVENRCREVLSAFSPDIRELGTLPRFIHNIAACYHPKSEQPAMRVTTGAFLQGIDKTLDRFDAIINRTGFKRLRSVSIRNIKNAHRWYNRISTSPFFSWYFRYKKAIRQILRSRLIILPDPFIWLAYLSNRLTLLLLVKYLMIDLHIFFGKLAIEAFGHQDAADGDGLETKEGLEATLQALSSHEEMNEFVMDPEVKQIREGLLGFVAVVTSTPSLTEWKNAVHAAGRIISKKYFPEAQNPLEEAALGPLLERSRHWIGTLGKGDQYLLSRYFYKMRLETLYRAKNLSELVLSRPFKMFLEKAFKTYGWFKWPFTVYRWVKRRSPWFIAVEVGWLAVKKSSMAYIYGKTFDQACKELEMVYRQSCDLRNVANK